MRWKGKGGVKKKIEIAEVLALLLILFLFFENRVYALSTVVIAYHTWGIVHLKQSQYHRLAFRISHGALGHVTYFIVCQVFYWEFTVVTLSNSFSRWWCFISIIQTVFRTFFVFPSSFHFYVPICCPFKQRPFVC